MKSVLIKHIPILASFGLGCLVASFWALPNVSSGAYAAEMLAASAASSNRVVAGDSVPVGKSWPSLDKDVYLHIQPSSNFDTAADCNKPGFRTVCGPNMNSSENVNVSLVQASRTIAGEESDLALETDGGYAAAWGWHPYVRLRRISAAAEGSWIIVQAVPGDPNTDRVILAHTEPGKKVSIWRNDQPGNASTIATLEGDMKFVDVTYNSGTYSVSAAKAVSSDAKVQELVEWVKGKMK